MEKDNEHLIKDIAEAFHKDKIISCGVETEIVNGTYGEQLTYTVIVENNRNPQLKLLKEKVDEAIRVFVHESKEPCSVNTNVNYSNGQIIVVLDTD